MCKRLKTLIILLLLLNSITILSKKNDYPILQNAYSWGVSGGVGGKYLSDVETVVGTLAIDTEFIIIDSFGLTLSDYFFVNNKKDLFIGNRISLAINIRPVFAIRFIKNKFSKDYSLDYFYNSISLNFGGVIQQTKFTRDEIKKDITSVGTKIGASFAFLLFYDKKTDIYLKTSIDYNFLQKMVFFDNDYDMNGFYFQVTLGISFRFGESIDWLIGEHENDKKVKVKFKK